MYLFFPAITGSHFNGRNGVYLTIHVRMPLIFSGAAQAHTGAETAAGLTLEACCSECDRARPDS